MSSKNPSEKTSAASEILVPPVETVRACTDRQRRLTEYIRGHTGANIAVRLIPFVPTACVMPTSREKLVDSNNADFSAEEAERLANSVDADYLVLISTAPATTERLPISDQLTADRAQQFGYALHELGHIRYTAIAASASMIRERVEKGHQEFVKGIWNSVEDAAIENQLALDQSQLAADRLEIVSRSISKPAEEFPPGHSVEFSFRDAIETALYDRGIYDTGVCERLCDSDDDQFVFASDADQQAFAMVDDTIDSLLGTILTTPNSIDRAEAVLDWWKTELEPLLSPPEQDESKDQQQGSETQSDGATQDSRQQDTTQNSGESSMDQQSQETETQQAPSGEDSDSQDGSDKGTDHRPDPSEINTDQRQETPGTDTLEYPDIGDKEDAEALEQPGENENEGMDPSDENTDSEGDDEGSEEGEGGSESGSDSDSEGEAIAEGSESSSEDDESADESASETTDGDAGDSPGDSTDSSKGSRKQESGADTDGAEGATGDTPPDSSASNPWMSSSDSTQTQSSLTSFGESENQSPADTDESPPETDDTPPNDSDLDSENTGSTAGSSSDKSPDEEGEKGTDETSNEGSDNRDASNDPIELGDNPSTSGSSRSEAGEDTDESDQTPEKPRTNESDEQGDERSDSEQNDELSVEGNQDNGDGESNNQENQESSTPDPSPAHEGSDLESSDALDADRKGAHSEADSSRPDESNLEHDLEDIEKALENLNEADEEADGSPESSSDGDGTTDEASQDSNQGDEGSGATPGSLDELSIMPTPDSTVADSLISERFEDAEDDADYTAGALRKALKQNRQSGIRSGLTSGSFDRRRAAALARGELNVFQVTQQGEEKKYDLVLILDRSISMRHAITTAEDAMVRFAIACEDIGINVGILDFYRNKARLVKPFSVETRFVQSSLFSGDREGGTPLSDALNIGRELLDQRSNSPLVIVVTDGKPGDADAYQDVLSNTYAPVCGLTLCLGRPNGNVPERVAQNERFYDRHMYVHNEPVQETSTD